MWHNPGVQRARNPLLRFEPSLSNSQPWRHSLANAINNERVTEAVTMTSARWCLRLERCPRIWALRMFGPALPAPLKTFLSERIANASPSVAPPCFSCHVFIAKVPIPPECNLHYNLIRQLWCLAQSHILFTLWLKMHLANHVDVLLGTGQVLRLDWSNMSILWGNARHSSGLIPNK